MRVAIILNLLISLTACDPQVEFDHVDPNQLISVTCIISPQDSVFTAYVYKASPLGSTIKSDSATVKDALVTISDGANYDTLRLTFDYDHPSTTRKIYKYVGVRNRLNIKANASYLLSVSTPQGTHASATCKVPPDPGVPDITGTREGDDFLFTIKWQNVDQFKYFSIVLGASGNYENPFPGGTGKIDLKPELLEQITFPSDKQIVTNEYGAILKYAFIATNPSLKISIRNVEEGLYQYFKNYRQFQQWDNDNNSGSLFPNFKEIPVIQGNVQGGVGIFGAYNSAITISEVR